MELALSGEERNLRGWEDGEPRNTEVNYVLKPSLELA